MTVLPSHPSDARRVHTTDRIGARAVSIVIPAFNEAARLPGTLRKLGAFLRTGRYAAEVIVVDDGSEDATRSQAEALRPELDGLRIISHDRNLGKGAAVRTGVEAARQPVLIFSDADLATPIEELDRLWSAYEGGWDVVIASRKLPGSRIMRPQPGYRRVMGDVFSMLVSLLGVRGFRDTQCGFKLFRTTTARRLFRRVKTKGFAFDVEVLLRARELGIPVAEVGVEWWDVPGSKIHPVRESLRMLLAILRMRGIV